MLRQPLTIISVVVAIYFVICLLAFVFQSRLVFFPDRNLVATPSAIGLAFEDVTIVTADEIKLHGWFVPAAGARRTLLFCHGNAGNISHRLESLRIFHDLGLSVMIFDYGGYGRSEGTPSEQGTYKDAEAVYQYLVRERVVAPNDIIVFGRSLGSAVAIELASRFEVAGVIAESCFTTLPDVGQRAYPILPVKLLSRIRYDSRARVGAIHTPKLFLHSIDDEILPYTLARQLYDAAAEPKQLVDMHGDHNSGFITSGEYYVSALARFVGSLDNDAR